jgi:RNA polymerase sigma-70 factor, ECF subfamily
MTRPPAPPEVHPPDDALVGRIVHGDAAALALLVERHEGTLLRLGRRVTGSTAAAQDVVQEVWLKLWTRADRYEAGRGRFTAWIKRVTVHGAIDWRRRAGPIQSGERLEEPAAAEDAPDRQAALAQMRARVRDAVEMLPARQREAIAHCYFAGLTAAQTAQRMGLSVPAAEALLVRARRALRTALRESLPSVDVP